MNRVFLMGNLTRDPEAVRRTPSGMAVTDLGLAVNRKYKAGSGEMKEETCFVNIVVWGNQAENCVKYLRKGSQVLVEGRLQYDEWERDGKKQSRLRVVADRVQFLGAPRSGQGRAAGEAPQRDEPAAQEPQAEGEATGGAEPAAAAGSDEDNLPF
jgi:single-strand DNA-binding protein